MYINDVFFNFDNYNSIMEIITIIDNVYNTNMVKGTKKITIGSSIVQGLSEKDKKVLMIDLDEHSYPKVEFRVFDEDKPKHNKITSSVKFDGNKLFDLIEDSNLADVEVVANINKWFKFLQEKKYKNLEKKIKSEFKIFFDRVKKDKRYDYIIINIPYWFKDNIVHEELILSSNKVINSFEIINAEEKPSDFKNNLKWQTNLRSLKELENNNQDWTMDVKLVLIGAALGHIPYIIDSNSSKDFSFKNQNKIECTSRLIETSDFEVIIDGDKCSWQSMYDDLSKRVIDWD